MKEVLKSIIKEAQSLQTAFQTKGSFTKNFSYLFSGRIFTILLSFCITPILTRLYPPEAYGFFSFFNAVVMNFAIISSFSYENALVIVKGERKFYNLILGCIILSSFLILLLIFCIGIYYLIPSLRIYLNLKNDSPTLYLLIIFGAIIYSNSQILAKWNVRRNRFKFISHVWVINQVSNRGVSLMLGFFYSSPIYGLVVAEIIGKSTSLIMNIKQNLIPEFSKLRNAVTINGVKAIIKSYKYYPFYILPSKYIGLLIVQVPIFIITAFFGVDILGNFSLALSIIYIPVLLISNTLSSVFLKKANDLKNDKAALNAFIMRLSWLITAVVLPFFIVLILFSDYLFPLIFGSNWFIAGELAGIIACFTIVELFQVFTLPLFQVYKKENKVFFINLIQFISICLLSIPGIYFQQYKLIVVAYGLVLYCFGWYRIELVLKLVGGSSKSLIITVTGIVLAVIALKYLI